jgi:hypothetical protein
MRSESPAALPQRLEEGRTTSRRTSRTTSALGRMVGGYASSQPPIGRATDAESTAELIAAEVHPRVGSAVHPAQP